ncbi:MAG: 1-deoxy-D-xylulose-5-phosphate reductoisomerase [Bacilli bacterium]|nr:1-deoxy-D-xylulose-5-phosphate reductoisomerase [Acholeplasmataceae bacterium]
MRDICLLGATGSIGTQVLEIIKGNKEYRLRNIAFGKNTELGSKIIEEFRPEYVSVLSESDMAVLQRKHPGVKFGFGEEGLLQAATYAQGTLINALVGMVGVLPTVAAIKNGMRILLANKETLVVAGEIINQLLKEYHTELIPIDSELSALHQCLHAGSGDVERLIITASGGPFRNLTRDELENVSVEDALRHPNWKMGPKITIDTATMANKGLEVIEAHHLFGIDYDRIETIIHPESIVHGMVEFKDKSVIAQLSVPDMRLPIQYALLHPHKKKNPGFQALDLAEIGALTFKKMDFERYPLLEMAYRAGKAGGLMPAVFNAANEVAVSLFLKRRIKFLEIEEIVSEALAHFKNKEKPSLAEIIVCDREIRNRILERYEVK